MSSTSANNTASGPSDDSASGGNGEFRLTPLLQMGTTPSPWNLIDWNKVPGTTPTPSASLHKMEKNQFESSFGAAIHPLPSRADIDDGSPAVPQMKESKPASSKSKPNASSDRLVPVAPTTAVKKRKTTTAKAGKTSKKTARESPTKTKPVLTEDERRDKRREQNRKNAAKCRQRKIDRVTTLTAQLEELQRENEGLKAAYQHLEQQYKKRVARSK